MAKLTDLTKMTPKKAMMISFLMDQVKSGIDIDTAIDMMEEKFLTKSQRQRLKFAMRRADQILDKNNGDIDSLVGMEI